MCFYERNEFLYNYGQQKENRTARYVCSLVFFDPEKKLFHKTQGICEGYIDDEITGNNGFGYDPLFIPIGFSTSFGVLPNEIKENISHRAKAIAQMMPFLEQWSEK